MKTPQPKRDWLSHFRLPKADASPRAKFWAIVVIAWAVIKVTSLLVLFFWPAAIPWVLSHFEQPLPGPFKYLPTPTPTPSPTSSPISSTLTPPTTSPQATPMTTPPPTPRFTYSNATYRINLEYPDGFSVSQNSNTTNGVSTTCVVIHQAGDSLPCTPDVLPTLADGHYLYIMHLVEPGNLAAYSSYPTTSIGQETGYLTPASTHNGFPTVSAYTEHAGMGYYFVLYSSKTTTPDQWQAQQVAFKDLLAKSRFS